ncbi:hypothetical protein, partial [Aeromonas sp. QDB50]|uniref:hypothetical protein n=1 Tax=Aeromonas sp. QDB50 TaxID=2990493 RepID=UPI0022E030A0
DKIRSQSKPFLYLFQLVAAKDPVHDRFISSSVHQFISSSVHQFISSMSHHDGPEMTNKMTTVTRSVPSPSGRGPG